MNMAGLRSLAWAALLMASAATAATGMPSAPASAGAAKADTTASPGAQARQATLPNRSTDRSLGTASCASSTCHGSTLPWSESTVLRNEYTTWLRLDPHSRAYGSLLNDTSRRMAQRLGLPQPAHQSALCLDCHAHHVPPAQRGERHVVQELSLIHI